MVEPSTTHLDLVVIGAGKSVMIYSLRDNNSVESHIGISGIYAAKFYLDVRPDCKLTILDRDACIGGSWNSSRFC